MKRILAVMIAMMMVSMAACGGKTETPTEAITEAVTEAVTEAPTQALTEAIVEESVVESADNELYSVIDIMYANAPALEDVMTMSMEVDLTDNSACVYSIGIGAEGIVSAVVSESMMDSVAHSIALIEVEEGTDVEAVKNAVFDGVDLVRWEGVVAEKLTVVNSGNVILLMVTTAAATEQLLTAFSDAMGGNLGDKLQRDGGR